jgi:hypothetical protein
MLLDMSRTACLGDKSCSDVSRSAYLISSLYYHSLHTLAYHPVMSSSQQIIDLTGNQTVDLTRDDTKPSHHQTLSYQEIHFKFTPQQWQECQDMPPVAIRDFRIYLAYGCHGIDADATIGRLGDNPYITIGFPGGLFKMNHQEFVHMLNNSQSKVTLYGVSHYEHAQPIQSFTSQRVDRFHFHLV